MNNGDSKGTAHSKAHSKGTWEAVESVPNTNIPSWVHDLKGTPENWLSFNATPRMEETCDVKEPKAQTWMPPAAADARPEAITA